MRMARQPMAGSPRAHAAGSKSTLVAADIERRGIPPAWSPASSRTERTTAPAFSMRGSVRDSMNISSVRNRPTPSPPGSGDAACRPRDPRSLQRDGSARLSSGAGIAAARLVLLLPLRAETHLVGVGRK